MTHSIRPLTLAERLEAVSDYRKAASYHRAHPMAGGDPTIGQKYENLADAYDPYYIQVDMVDDNWNVILPQDPDDDVDQKW